MLLPFANHKREYAGFFVVAILISIVAFSLYKARAEGELTFVKDIKYTEGWGPDNYYMPSSAPYSVTIDPSGNMYVGDAWDHVYKFDATGNLVLTIGGPGTADGQFSFVQGITLDALGNIYVVDAYNRRIQKFDSSGNFLMKFGELGSADGQFFTPEDVAVDSLGNIYVADNNYIHKFDSSGNFLLKFGGYGTGDGQLTGASGIAIDASGDIYVVGGVRVTKFASSTAFIMKFGTDGTGNGQFTGIGDINVDSSGNIYIADTYGQNIQKFDSSGNFLMKFGGIHGGGDGEFDYPLDMAVDSVGNIYVADKDNGRVQKFDSNGTYLAQWSSGVLVDTDPFSPYKVAADSFGNIFAVDDMNYRILKFASDGSFVTKFGDWVGENALSWPDNVAVDSNNNVYVTDCDYGVKIYSNSGTFISNFATSTSFDCASAIAFDYTGNVYVADDLGYIEKFDSAGTHLGQIGGPGTGDGQFGSWIEDIAVDTAGNLYVTDTNNYRIQKFNPSGEFVMKFGVQGNGNGGFGHPAGVAVDAEGGIYVADWNRMDVQRFDASGVYTSIISEAGGVPFTDANDVSIGSSGNLYIADYTNNRVSVFAPSVTVTLALSDVSATSTASSTTVSWTSDLEGSSQVEYGPTENYGSVTEESDTAPRVTSHTLSFATPACSFLHYRAVSRSSTETETASSHYSLQTSGCTGSATIVASTTVDASTESTSTVTLATLTLSIPPDFAIGTSATTTFQATLLEPAAFFASSSLPTGTRSASAEVFHLAALTPEGSLTSFTTPLTLTMTYLPDALSGIDPATLTIYRHDEGVWTALSNCSRNASARTVICETTHFSDFALFGSPDTSSVTYSASGYLQADGSLSVTSPVNTGRVSSSPSSAVPVALPAGVLPKPTLPTPIKTAPKATGTLTVKASPTPAKTLPLVKPAVTTNAQIQPAVPPAEASRLPAAQPPAPVKKSFFQNLVEKVKGWLR
jgi:tripartite motif-containing protein 71